MTRRENGQELGVRGQGRRMSKTVRGRRVSPDSSHAPCPMPLFPSLTALLARVRSAFVAAPFLMVIAALGCHSSSESTRQTRAESISPAKGDDTTLLASGTGGSSAGAITKSSDASGPASGTPQSAGQTGASTSVGSRWSNFFGRKPSSDGLVLPRNDQDAENGAPDKTAANEF